MIYKSKYNPLIHNRQSIRLKCYDYAKQGLYFITICCQNRMHLFGQITDGVMFLNDAGRMIETEWLALPNYFNNIRVHEFIIMPNHFHSILEITGATLVVAPNNDLNIDGVIGQPQGIAPNDSTDQNHHDDRKPKTIGNIIGAFKSKTTVEYIKGIKNLNWEPFEDKIWQRNYHEIIIRDERALHNISNYIIKNPQNFK